MLFLLGSIAVWWVKFPARETRPEQNTRVSPAGTRGAGGERISFRTVSSGSLSGSVLAGKTNVSPVAGSPKPRLVFGGGVPFLVSDLPPSDLRSELESLPRKEREFALARLTDITFHVADLESLHVSASGMPYFVCKLSEGHPVPPASVVVTARTETAGQGETGSADGMAQKMMPDTGPSQAPAPITPYPGLLASVPVSSPPIRHSRPGCSRVLYLDFSGHVVTNTDWNTTKGVARWDCAPFDTDGNTNTFSDVEQTYIIQMWERIAEDYAPFDVDVTTELPATWTPTTGHALITPTIDMNGVSCPHSTAGGIAYVNVFGTSSYSYDVPRCYSPAWVKPMSSYSYDGDTAAAASHELGHNLGLSHDGNLIGGMTNAYYGGHGSGDTSWAPIMGSGPPQNVTQWSKGEYYAATQTQDDLAILSAKVPYRTDDYGNTNATAMYLKTSNGTILVASGIIERNTDVDVLSFVSGSGAISITAFPYRCASGTFGGNLDIQLRLYNTNGTVLAEANPAANTYAILNTTLATPGVYYLHISNSGVGDPYSSTPTGYTAYGSLGQYFITGRVTRAAGVIVFSPNGGETWYKGQTNTISWFAGTNMATTAKLELYRGVGRFSVITNSVTNTGSYAWLVPNPMYSDSNYTIRVSSATDTSLWDQGNAPFTITTLMSTGLFFENFDVGPFIPSGWSQTNLSGSTTTWKFKAGAVAGAPLTTAFSAPYNACLADSSETPDVCRLITPALNMSGLLPGCTGAVLRFYHHMQYWLPCQDYLNVWVRTNANAAWLWVTGYSNSIAAWTRQSVPLPGVSTNYTIAFEGIATFGYGVCLDDVDVTGYAPDINTVTNQTPMAWLVGYGLDPTDSGALSDSDSDGIKAWEEWLAGTCPTQKLSLFTLSNGWSAASGRVLQWGAIPDRVYSVIWTSNLTTTAFQPLDTNITSGVYTDSVHVAEPAGFYRVGVRAAP